MTDTNTPHQTTPSNQPTSGWLALLVRVVFVVLCVLALLVTILFYAIGTQTGTAWILDEIAKRANISITHTDGNLKDGLWVSDIKISPTDTLTININRAYLQLSWRAILTQEVSLVDTHIERLDIIDKAPPTGESFAYEPIVLPIKLHLKNAYVKTVSYQQATQKPIYLRQIKLGDARWADTRLSIKDGQLHYDNDVEVTNVVGKIDFSKQYPLEAQAEVMVHAMTQAHFSTLKVHAGGTLKRTTGTLTSKYNQHDIRGEFALQALDKNVPFNAQVYVDEVVLPYAKEQNIILKNGIINASGVLDNIELRLNTDLSGKDIPAGRYHGRGVVHDGGMDISRLAAHTDNGELVADGRMSWQDEFELTANIRGDGYRVREVMPLEYRDYQAYLPKTLTGVLGVRYLYLDKALNETRLEFDLKQKDGERVTATLAQAQDNPDAPWRIQAQWQNLIRHAVPDIEHINSPHGSATIRLEEGRTYIDAKALVNELSVAPKGDYQVQANIEKGERIHLTNLIYQGAMGDLSGKGSIELATTKTPLRWQFDLKTQQLKPNAYFNEPNKTPFSAIKGRVVATGRMRDSKQGQIHDIELNNSDLTATLMDNNTVWLAGDASANVTLKNGTLTHINASFEGEAEQSLLPQLERAKLGVQIAGNLDQLTISKLTFFNPSAKLSAVGKVMLKQGIGWDIKARLDEVDTAKFAGKNSDLIAQITGDLATTGLYHHDKLQHLTANFDGQLLNKNLPKGRLSFDMAGNEHKIQIHHLSHQGQAGDVLLKGMVDIDKLSVAVSATMKELNLANFVRGIDSRLTGSFAFDGNFGGAIKSLALKNLAIQGSLNKQPFNAKGSLLAKLHIPKNLNAYFNNLKNATHAPKSTDELINLQRRIEANTRQTQQIVKQLQADNLTINMGDNFVNMHGNEQKLTTTLNIANLSQILPSTRGVIQGGMILVNDNNALPTLYLDLNVHDVRTADAIIQKATVLGRIENLANSPSQLLVDVQDVIAFGKVIKQVHVDFRGTEQKHLLTMTTKNADVEAQARIEGGFDRIQGRYQGVLEQGRVNTKFGILSQNQPAQFSYGVNNQSIHVAAHCWQTKAKANKAGVVCLQDTLSYTPTSGKVNVVLQNLDTSVLSAALPSDIVWKSTLNGKVQASWQKSKTPMVNAVLYSDNGRVGVNQEDTGYIELPYERVSLIAQSVPTGLKIRTDIAGTAGRGYADVVIDPYKTNKPIAGAMAIHQINLAVLRPFFPDLQVLKGNIDIAGGIGGTLSKPLFYGNAELTQGQIAVNGVPLNLSDIGLVANIRGTQAQLTGVFKSGEGDGELSGQVDWQQDIQAKIGIAGSQLNISSPPMLTAQLNPDIEVIIKPLQRYVKVQGVLLIPSAVIRPPAASADIVVESADVSVIDRRLTGNVAKILAVSAPWSINADIGLDLGADVTFRGFGAKLPLAGALHLTQSGRGAMQARGVVQVSKRAKIDGVGQNLELNYAQVRFNGDMLNPRLSIEGQKQIEGQTVGLRIKGTASRPDITVFNDAGLTEQQAMNALITGRISESSDSQTSEQTFRSQVTNNLAAAGLSLGLSGTRNITNQIGNALGLESLTVDASGNSSDTNVNVTGYISPDLYIRYGVGVFNAESSLSMRYQLTRRIYIEATQATENVIDVIYRWKF